MLCILFLYSHRSLIKIVVHLNLIKFQHPHCIYEKNLSAKTIKAYKIDLNQFLKYKNSEDISLEMFDKLYLKDYIKYLFEKELKAKSVKRKVGTLKTLFNFLEFFL